MTIAKEMLKPTQSVIFVLSKKSRLTQRAADGGYAARFLSFFVALGFSRFDGESCPTHQAANACRKAITGRAHTRYFRRSIVFLDNRLADVRLARRFRACGSGAPQQPLEPYLPDRGECHSLAAALT